MVWQTIRKSHLNLLTGKHPPDERLAANRASIPRMPSLMKIILTVLALATGAPQAVAQVRTSTHAAIETYESAEIDASGNLRILTSNQKTITVPKDGLTDMGGVSIEKQTAFEAPVLSDDRHAVGATALFRNCCTSYDIPLHLVIYTQGKTHRFVGGQGAIFDWHFADSGKRVVFSQQAVHFGCSVHWELRDVATERIVATADVPEPCGQIPDPPKVRVPMWVTGKVSGLK